MHYLCKAKRQTPFSINLSLMFNNLNELEVSYFTAFNANGTTLAKFYTAQKSIKKSGDAVFEKRIKLWHQVDSLWTAFNSDEEKARRAEAGITMTSTDFSTKVLGYKDRSMKNSILRAVNSINDNSDLMTAYKREMTRLGKGRSLKGFNAFAKQVEAQVSKGATTDEAAEATADAQATADAVSCIAQLQFFGLQSGRVALKEDGTFDFTSVNLQQAVEGAKSFYELLAAEAVRQLDEQAPAI